MVGATGGARPARRWLAAGIVAALVLAACDDGGASPGTTTTTTTTTTGAPTAPTNPTARRADLGPAPRLFGVHLSAGASAPAAALPANVVAGEDLPPDRIEEIAARLPAWDPNGGAPAPFAWPAQSPPPPRTGATVDVPFPLADTTPPPDVPTGDLHVLRVQPEGPVPIAPYLSITFDQPMVPVGTVGQLTTAQVPVTITPAIDGQWQWIGTRTLRFDAAPGAVDRLPMATTLHVEVPAGTTSATGGVLAETRAFDVVTPPPTVQTLAPQGTSLALAQTFIATFDQRVDPAAVLATIHLRAGRGDVAVRVATPDEVAADDAVAALSAQAGDGRWVAFRPIDPLPADTALTIDVGPGTPSAEGPAVSESAASFADLRTYAPLRAELVCILAPQCPPGSPLQVRFNNAIDAGTVDTAQIVVDPPIAGTAITAFDGGITIEGATEAATTYTVTVPGGITDVFGQSLGSDQQLSVTTGSALASINQLGEVTTLDPFADGQRLPLVTVNQPKLRVRTFAADPSMFAEYNDYLRARYNEGSALPDWQVLSDRMIEPGGEADHAVETELDLAGELGGAHGQVIVLVEPEPPVSPGSQQFYERGPTITWVQSTELGIDTVSDNGDVLVWVTDLRGGAPRAGATVTANGAQATTDADGVARLPLGGTGDDGTVITATDGDDTAILRSWVNAYPTHDAVRWHVFTDRGVYLPGDTLRAKGWLRLLTLSGDAQLAPYTAGTTVHYVVHDGYGGEVVSGDTTLGPLGNFSIEAELGAVANLGQGYLQLTVDGPDSVDGRDFGVPLELAEYRRPEFAVSTAPRTQPPFLSTAPVTVDATASYYAGGPLAAAPVDWRVTTAPATYAPPGWDEFTFGIWRRWWVEDVATESAVPCCPPGIDTADVAEFHGTTDAAGQHPLQLDFEDQGGALPDLPVTVTAEATVTDVNRQAWAARSTLLVHPAERYVGLRAGRAFVRRGDPIDVDAVVTAVDGTVQPDVAVTLTAGRITSAFADGQWKETVTDAHDCTITSAAEPVRCSFDTSAGGEYKVTAVVTDEHGGRSRSELRVWVSGAERQVTRLVETQQLTLVPDRQHYADGDTAEVLVQAPFATGEGLLTSARNRIRSTQRFTLADGSAVLQVPIAETDAPQLALSVEVVGTAVRTAVDGTPQPDLPPRPAVANGSLVLDVPPAGRTLAVTATPQEATLAPGGNTTVDVAVAGADGAPVADADVLVAVVDEAVLALTDYHLADPLDSFFANAFSAPFALSSRNQISLRDLQRQSGGGIPAPATTIAASGAVPQTAETSAPSMSGGSPTGDRKLSAGVAAPIDVRSDFAAVALFAPALATDAGGHVAVPVTLPANLTRYRVMVVAASGTDRFGTAESDITARLPLAVRPSPPRFANFGDRFQLPVVVQNQGGTALDVDVLVQTANLTIDGSAGKRVQVPADGRVEVRFPVTTAQAGTATFRVTAVEATNASGAADSASGSLPVFTPATAEAFATYGVIDGDPVAQPLVAPTDVVAQFGGLEIDTSSTALQALTDAVLYIDSYRYTSSDGLAARIIAFTSLQDVLAAFGASGLPAPEVVDGAIDTDVAALAGMQNDDGGFPWWQRGAESIPFDTVQVTHALLAARAAGHVVPQPTLDRALQFLADIESHIPPEYGDAQRDSVRAYALWVRNLAGQADPAKAQALYQERGEQLSVEALAWLWPTITDRATSDAIERTIGNRAVETAGAANFVTDYGDGAYLTMQSDRRTDGIVLDNLITMRPTSDLIPKVVTGLLANRVAGKWRDIQENSFILLALHHYFTEYEGQTPDFVARAWLGDRFAGEHQFAGRQTDRASIDVPMSELLGSTPGDLVLAKDGSGRLYYRIGLRYAPADLSLEALDRGFVVARTYAAVDDPGDVQRDADGTWRVKAGARVRVTLTMVAESQRAHVALVDPLPAGFEALNPDLAVTQTTPGVADIGGGGGGPRPLDGWWGRWYEHEQLRDDRSEAFTTLLPAGTFDYRYVARATTPGEFVVPPARAEEMYAPETFGRSASERVVVA